MAPAAIHHTARLANPNMFDMFPDWAAVEHSTVHQRRGFGPATVRVKVEAEAAVTFTCSFSCTDDVATITPRGDLDLTATGELRTALQAAAMSAGITSTVVDLSSVTFMDSTALGVLVAARTAARASWGDLRRHQPRPHGHHGPHRDRPGRHARPDRSDVTEVT